MQDVVADAMLRQTGQTINISSTTTTTNYVYNCVARELHECQLFVVPVINTYGASVG